MRSHGIASGTRAAVRGLLALIIVNRKYAQAGHNHSKTTVKCPLTTHLFFHAAAAQVAILVLVPGFLGTIFANALLVLIFLNLHDKEEPELKHHQRRLS